MMTLSSDEISGMRDTVNSVQLDHICDIARRAQSGTDPDGNATYSWETLLENEPCHFWESSEEELEGTENVLLTTRRLILKANTNVTPLDRVTRIVDNDGDVIANDFDIEQALQRLNEVVCTLKEIE